MTTRYVLLAALLAALASCGGKSAGTTTPSSQAVAIAWTAVELAEPPPDTSDNVRVAITIGGVAHELGTARGDNIEGVQGPKACLVETPSPTETALRCAAGLAYTRFVATLAGGQLVIARHEGVSAEEANQEDKVVGEPKRMPAAGTTLTVAPYTPKP